MKVITAEAPGVPRRLLKLLKIKCPYESTLTTYMLLFWQSMYQLRTKFGGKNLSFPLTGTKIIKFYSSSACLFFIDLVQSFFQCLAKNSTRSRNRSDFQGDNSANSVFMKYSSYKMKLSSHKIKLISHEMKHEFVTIPENNSTLAKTEILSLLSIIIW